MPKLNKVCRECSGAHYAKKLCKKHYMSIMAKKNGYYRRFHSKNREKRNLQVAEYRKNNRGQILKSGRKYGKTVRRRWLNLKYLAKKRGLGFSIKLEDYQALSSKPCHYCESPSMPLYGSGLDRLNNKKGYHLSNVVRCCRNCNVLRSDLLTTDELKQVIQLLKKIRGDHVWKAI